jgi:hypothetical protein
MKQVCSRPGKDIQIIGKNAPTHQEENHDPGLFPQGDQDIEGIAGKFQREVKGHKFNTAHEQHGAEGTGCEQ